MKIELIQADITQLHVDAVVNAANNSLLGGGGVDGAIHQAAGPQLLAECIKSGGCPTGEARITKGYNLNARYVIHTVGPVWNGGNKGESKLLAECYRNVLRIAEEYNVTTLAFPNISTGVYGYPKMEAALIAVSTVKEFHNKNNSIRQLFFCCFDAENFKIYNNILHPTQ